MADSSVQQSTALNAMLREYKVKAAESSAMFETVLKLLAEKEAECDNLRFDWQDQTESRRHWHKRATDAETRISSVQYVLLLIDGNQTFFKADLIRGQDAQVAVSTLVREAKELARTQHKNDLPESLSVIVHIFIDVGKLAEDLSTAGVLPEPDQLWTFIQLASNLEPGVTITDCGAGQQAVDAKMQHFYELYLENCHCRHLFLALGQLSKYYETLSTYADDQYTKLKTSLVKPIDGLPVIYSLPFHVVEFSTLETVCPSAPHSHAPISSASKATGPVFGASPTGTRANGTTTNSAYHNSSPASVTARTLSTNGTPTAKTLGPSLSNRRAPSDQAALSPRSTVPTATTATKDLSDDRHIESTDDITTKVENTDPAGVVKLDTSSHSSHQSNTGAEESWETTTNNKYVQDPISAPWGEVDTTNQPASGNQDFSGPQPYTRRRNNNNNNSNNSQHREQFRSGGGSVNGFNGKQDRSFDPGRKGPRQFEGSWDDMVAGSAGASRAPTTQGSSTPPRLATVSMSSSATSKSTDLNAFRQVEIKAEPNPQARPVHAPIALNKSNQRIDLKLPRPANEAAFKQRTTNRHLCNEQHMRGKCNDRDCTYDHEDISDEIYLALRNKARHSPCNQGSRCRRHDCYLGHHCPNVSSASACGRPKCPFEWKGLHKVLDQNIVQMIEPGANIERGSKDLNFVRTIEPRAKFDSGSKDLVLLEGLF